MPDDEIQVERLVLRGKTYVYATPLGLAFGVLAAAGGIDYITNASGTGEVWQGAALCVVALLLVWAGIRAAMGGIRGDSRGVRITNLWSRHFIAWPDLQDITYRESGWDASGSSPIEWTLVFVRTDGGQVRSSFPRGRKDTGLGYHREVLLRMRDRSLGRQDLPSAAAEREWIGDSSDQGADLLRVKVRWRPGETAPRLVLLRANLGCVLVWSAIGIFLAIMAWAAGSQPPPEGDAAAAWIMGSIAAALFLLAIWSKAGWRLRATPRGVMVFNLLTWDRVRWHQVTDITATVEPDPEAPAGFSERLGLETTRGRFRAWAAAVEDPNSLRPELLQVKSALLAMRDRHAGPQPHRPGDDSG